MSVSDQPENFNKEFYISAKQRLYAAEDIAAFMASKNISADDLALKLDCSLDYINMILSGQAHDLTIGRLAKIAVILDCKLDIFLEKKADQSKSDDQPWWLTVFYFATWVMPWLLLLLK
jgi:transcriptional regulator with XRE-family HTH domain